MRASTRALILFSIVSPTLGALYTSSSQLPTKKFDYVIVGAGAGGPVVANRLTEDPNVSVLLLEAGDSNQIDPMMAAPLLGPLLTPGTTVDWNYSTIKQPHYNNRQVPYIRGYVLGGTTSINYMIHNTGPIDDWEYYAKVSGDKGWSWQSMRKYFFKAERIVPPSDGHDTKGQWDPAVHGKDGMVKLSLPGNSREIDKLVLSATKEFPDALPYNLDQNSGKPIGISWTQSRIGDGERDSSATAYLAPKYLARPNLHVLVKARVTKVLKTGDEGALPIFRGVEFADAPALTTRTKVFANKEVILSAGVINTPQILQLSGIGDSKELSKVGITTIVDLPSVGKNMSDHPLILPTWEVTSTDTFDPIMRQDPIFQPEFKGWEATHKGPLTDTVANLIGWLRFPKNDPIFKVIPDPSVGPNAPHVEMIFYNSFFDPHGLYHPSTGNYLTIMTVLVTSASRGTISLSSSDPFQMPVIDPQFFSHPFDQPALVSGLKMANKIVTSSPWKGYIKSRFGPAFQNATTDEELAKWAAGSAFCLFHGVGTASMSPKGASWGVVDPDLRVKGVVGLRIVDASVIPLVPTAHPMGPIYAIAERASDLIKGTSSDGAGWQQLLSTYFDSPSQAAYILGPLLLAVLYLGTRGTQPKSSREENSKGAKTTK